MDVREVIARRADLSTFLVHLTRTDAGGSARDRLAAILTTWRIEARSMFGAAKSRLDDIGIELQSQKCVCFTETPLEYVQLLHQVVDNRQIQFSPYGIAIPKKLGRTKGVNPVWYIDITPGHDWLTVPINELIDHAIAAAAFDNSHIGRLAPFIEQMGTRRNPDGTLHYRKEFWWEREWRHVGNFTLPDLVIVLCPEHEFGYFQAVIDAEPLAGNFKFLDPSWGLEQIIARLAGYDPEDSDIL